MAYDAGARLAFEPERARATRGLAAFPRSTAAGASTRGFEASAAGDEERSNAT